MKILLINHYAGSLEMGMEFRPYYMACKWNEMGHQTTIIGSSYSHLRQKQPQVLGWDNIDGINYFWLWSNKYKGNGIARLLTMFLFVTQLLFLSLYFAIKIKPSVVIASSTYPLDIIPSWLISKISRAKLVFEIHDLWPMAPQELGKMSKFHPFIIIMKLGEWLAYKFSDKIVSILPKAYGHVKKFGVKKSNYLHIPNGINLKDYENKTNLAIEAQKKINSVHQSKFKLIGYAGAIGVANAIDILVEAAYLLSNEKIGFFIVGDGQEFENIQKFVKKHNLKNVHMLGRINKLAINTFLSQMDFLYIGAQHQKMYKYGVGHNKAFDYMMAQKPIIQSMEINGDVVKRAGASFNAVPGSVESLVETIMKAVATPAALLEDMGKKGKDFALKNHEYDIIARQFTEFLSSK